METFSQFSDAEDQFEVETSLALGNFDGLHLGHQEILKRALREAKSRDIPSGVFTFNKHPREILSPHFKPQSILTSLQKEDSFSKRGFSFCFFCNEGPHFFKKTPEAFVEEILVNIFHVKVVSVGENFRFGCDASGGVDDLKRFQKKYGFELFVVPLFKKEGEVVSSTAIRKAIREGDFLLANQLLGYFLFLKGKVIRGENIGKSLGFPTANVSLSDGKNLDAGVYAVTAWLKKEKFSGVMNVGVAPTMKKNSERQIEIHLLDYNGGDFYGEFLTFRIEKKIREEKTFESPEALKAQIKKDLSLAVGGYSPAPTSRGGL